ncbi:glutamate receptor ionotropic, NMDA 2B isoform X6 [Onthophagus taurus]|uniref:glutamate receptor ionotropic, NMDA 2B isoform X6 n=1 Tax=Onthophagus taurus TaxID=166361 RepID=UPI0039BE9643
MATMNFVAFSLTLLVAAVVSGGPAWKETTIQRGGGLKIGTTHVNGRNVSAPRGTGIKVGSGGRGFRTTTTMIPFVVEEPPPATFLATTSASSITDEVRQMYVGMVVPHTTFGRREYVKAFQNTKRELGKKLGKLFERYDMQSHIVMKELTPSPIDILNSLCQNFVSYNVSAILYLMNYEQYGRSTASAQYFLQLAGYLGIPVIAWNADNSGLERRASQTSVQLQLAPSLEHQTAAMLSILERYKWHQFSVVTSLIAGHDDFIQAVRERVSAMQDRFKFTILNAVLFSEGSDIKALVDADSRVMLLYCTRKEAITILSAAKDYGIIGENYVWVVTQSVIENPQQPPNQFPIGMLGVHFDTSSTSLVNEITTAIKVFAHGVENFLADPENEGRSLNTQLSCDGAGAVRWDTGDRFYRYLRNVTVEQDAGKPNVEFTQDGVLKATELKIMNLRPAGPGLGKQQIWEEIGAWKSWQVEGLDIKDIVWPGDSHTPPQGVPEKFHLKITFLEEPPYINLAPLDPVTEKCSMDRGVICRIPTEAEFSDVEATQSHRNGTVKQCCSGFCIDLLEKFSEELGFTYELVRVEDGRWGTNENGRWNGLIADLVNKKTDMVMTSLMINSEREAAVDFSVPFMETGIAIVVAKRTGIISPTAFLEPFDTASWMLVGAIAIQAATFTIFLFEWLSPSGFDMKLSLNQPAPSASHRFSLFRTYWLVWAVLFQAAVHVDSPRGFTSRFMTNVWAMFAVVFLAIYTANLAAFMITREEFYEFSGVNDSRLSRPFSHKPMFKYGTIPWSHTDSTISKYFKEMHKYMRNFNKTTVLEGVDAVLTGDLDAFIYDGTVLDYLTSQDEDCRLLTVGSWYAMTGYGLAFPRNFKYLKLFNKKMLEFRGNGDLERLRRYWMTGTCKPGKEQAKSSDPLALEQFLSAFLLLMAGILLAALLLLLEHIYFKYLRKHLAKTDRGGCCALVSLSMGKSLTFRGAVYEAQDILRNHRCRDPICDTHLWKVKRELDISQMRCKQLEKELEAHGLKPPPACKRRHRRSNCCKSCLGSSDSPDVIVSGEQTRARLRGLNPNYIGSNTDLNKPRTEIAEMETVL